MQQFVLVEVVVFAVWNSRGQKVGMYRDSNYLLLGLVVLRVESCILSEACYVSRSSLIRFAALSRWILI
jgi:hypothetical protein